MSQKPFAQPLSNFYCITMLHILHYKYFGGTRIGDPRIGSKIADDRGDGSIVGPVPGTSPVWHDHRWFNYLTVVIFIHISEFVISGCLIFRLTCWRGDLKTKLPQLCDVNALVFSRTGVAQNSYLMCWGYHNPVDFNHDLHSVETGT